jgi:hypothetical protein
MVLEKRITTMDYHTLKVIRRNSEMPNANTQECVREHLFVLQSKYTVQYVQYRPSSPCIKDLRWPKAEGMITRHAGNKPRGF